MEEIAFKGEIALREEIASEEGITQKEEVIFQEIVFKEEIVVQQSEVFGFVIELPREKLIERLEEVERVNAKLEKKEKEKEFKFTKAGGEKQYKFNGKMKNLLGDKLKNELKKHFNDGLPEKGEEIIKEGEKELDEQIHKLKIADEFGFKSLDDFVKEDLARDDKEEKKLKALRKEKKEREEKGRARRGGNSYRSFRDSYRGFNDSFRGFKDKEFGDKINSKDDGKSKSKDDTKCFNCQRYGH